MGFFFFFKSHFIWKRSLETLWLPSECLILLWYRLAPLFCFEVYNQGSSWLWSAFPLGKAAVKEKTRLCGRSCARNAPGCELQPLLVVQLGWELPRELESHGLSLCSPKQISFCRVGMLVLFSLCFQPGQLGLGDCFETAEHYSS